MPYKKVIAYLEGVRTTTSSNLGDIEVDVCNEVFDFFEHDNFCVEYTIDTIRTISGQVIGREVRYKAWEREL